MDSQLRLKRLKRVTWANVLWYAYEQRGFFDGYAAGYKDGAKETKLSLARLMLVFHLQKRFGEPKPSILERIEHASIMEIEGWIVRLVEAHSIDELFPES